MTPEKKKEWKAHIKVYRKYAKEASQWLKDQEEVTANAGPGTPIPPPPTPPGQDNPPGKPPNP